MPALYEGFGMVPLEAMASGTPRRRGGRGRTGGGRGRRGDPVAERRPEAWRRHRGGARASRGADPDRGWTRGAAPLAAGRRRDPGSPGRGGGLGGLAQPGQARARSRALARRLAVRRERHGNGRGLSPCATSARPPPPGCQISPYPVAVASRPACRSRRSRAAAPCGRRDRRARRTWSRVVMPWRATATLADLRLAEQHLRVRHRQQRRRVDHERLRPSFSRREQVTSSACDLEQLRRVRRQLPAASTPRSGTSRSGEHQVGRAGACRAAPSSRRPGAGGGRRARVGRRRSSSTRITARPVSAIACARSIADGGLALAGTALVTSTVSSGRVDGGEVERAVRRIRNGSRSLGGRTAATAAERLCGTTVSARRRYSRSKSSIVLDRAGRSTRARTRRRGRARGR